MLNKLKEVILKNGQLYVLAKCIKSLRDPEMSQLLRGFFRQPQDNLSLILNSPSKHDQKVIYYIDLGVNDYRSTGFCALLRNTILALIFSNHLGLVPYVKWGSGTVYYEKELDSYTDNAFLYYFKPISEINNLENVQYISWKYADIEYYMQKKWEPYGMDNEELILCAESYKRNIHLNQKTANFIELNVSSIIKGKKVLGVHARGTDFNLGLSHHPKAIISNIYIKKIQELLKYKKYDVVFVATEDKNLLDSFKDAFKDKLVYYKDVFRTEGTYGPHGTHNNRSLHHYRLGLEVLRDVYTLANCDSLVCGLSQVSFAARYINMALGKKFDEVIIIDNGINNEDSKKAKLLRKKDKKLQKDFQHDLHQNP